MFWICKEPGDVEVVVSPEALQREFTGYDANRLRSLLKSMKAGPSHIAQRDKRLLEAVVQIREAVRYNLRPALPLAGGERRPCRRPGFVGSPQLGAPAFASSRSRRNRSRLNLFNALLGGMFGTAAAHWIIDTLFVAASRSSVPLEEGRLRLPLVQPPPAGSDGEAAPETQLDRLDLVAARRRNRPLPTRF